jgi:hypothetical protein
MVYISSERAIATLDPTFDGLDPKFQATIASTSGASAFPIDGLELAAITGTTLQRLATADHKPVGDPIDVQISGITDAARVPGERRVVVGGTGGLAVANIDTGEVRVLATSPKPDRVAVAGSVDAGFTAYALIGRVAPPTGTGTCTGSSMVLAYALDRPTEQPIVVDSGQLSDIEAVGDAVFAANPCTGAVTRIDAGAPKILLNVGGAAALASEGGRLYVAGSAPERTTEGAHIRIASVRQDGSDAQEILLPGKAEVMTYDGDPEKELSLDIHADTQVALDLAVLPGAPYVALITRMDSHRLAAYDAFTGAKIIPEMAATVHDLVLADPQSGAIAQRIRAKCVLTLIQKTNAEFPDWSCIGLSGAEAPLGGESTPTMVGALYGDR